MSVAGDCVMVPELRHSQDAGGEEGLRSFRLERCVQLYLNRHEFPVGSNIKELVAISSPPWLGSTTGRDPQWPTGRRECLYIHLWPSGHIGGVGYPFSIWRVLRLLFVKISFQE